MTTLATFWAGRLGPIEMASLASFARQGQTIVIYSYGRLPDVPAGFENRDAAEVLPAREVATYRKEGSPSLHSNFFRYALMRETDHVWVDLDVIALRPFEFTEDRVYAYENPERVNCAVLRLPKDSPTLAALLAFGPGQRGVAPHITGLRRARQWIKTFGRGVRIEDWPWGSTGPRALTTYLRTFDEIRFAMPRTTFYPVRAGRFERFLTPGDLADDSFPKETYGVHLAASVIQRRLRETGGPIPEGSFLWRQIERARAEGFAA
ncbi:hypothetical protein [Rubellimicrobium aerolatum]|uniref:Alpha 1,4-glycosyltransferase domain-containing protein n=1 Tax=Rubellimicrobium aerolatum TaxID=490979 RepID=A0ABW0SCT5_9RHOB|nr:hypothetical protein [Rubellimicrobium aerolatum]MBP1806548.1 hypothetical protein [Rubellimicrobium aerolatum]